MPKKGRTDWKQLYFILSTYYWRDFGFRISFGDVQFCIALEFFQLLNSVFNAFAWFCVKLLAEWFPINYDYSTILILLVYTWENGFGIEMERY